MLRVEIWGLERARDVEGGEDEPNICSFTLWKTGRASSWDILGVFSKSKTNFLLLITRTVLNGRSILGV